MKYIFTSESVGEGHPDKLCDQISDAVLDEALRQDEESRVACECLATRGMVVVSGEITTTGYIQIAQIARDVLREIGYDRAEYGMDYRSCGTIVTLNPQSPDIARGVDKKKNKKTGAGDQGMMFGYACRETPELMPAPVQTAHTIMRRAAEVRHQKILDFLRPDAKCQVSMLYENDKPVSVQTVVLSHQHDPGISGKELKEALIEEIIKKAVPAEWLTDKTGYFINPTGRFVLGGPVADAGLTGRKIIVDTYGGSAPHGGGAFSGKDPSKVDRSAAYFTRYITKNLVAAGLCERCLLQVSYAIGLSTPVSVFLNSFGTGVVSDLELAKTVKRVFDLSPDGIMETLRLKRPLYRKTAVYGHFGRKKFPWEKTDKTKELQKAIR